MNTTLKDISKPKVSVILTSCNHGKYIQSAIDSVLNQSFTDFELIIWDDASSDHSWDLIEQYSDRRIKAFRNEVQKRGVWGINKAISDVAVGEYIAIFHSDDIWEIDKLAKQVAYLDENLDIGAVFTTVQAINERGMPLANSAHVYCSIFNQPNRSRHEWLRSFFLGGNALCHPSILIRKICYADCGLYRYGLGQLGDFDMWVRLCAKYEIHVMADPLIQFRVRDGELNTSGNRPEARIRSPYEHYRVLQLYKAIVGNGEVFKIFPDFISYDKGNDTDPEYVLARVCLESGDFYLREMLAIEILFDSLNDPLRSELIKRVYGFTSCDFISLTGQHDIFSREVTHQLQISVAERDAQMDNFITDLDIKIKDFVADRDMQINNLNNIIAERDAQITTLNYLIASLDAQIGKSIL
ncbi:putative glycosyltransferase EpsE [mine drainage metagenome]|uniref:Putative glycosyltransferase EpsE n=1 Tax=mine drainage metagenome TaxID=410659 RepID=A0A1J5SB45_9ZZZZ